MTQEVVQPLRANRLSLAARTQQYLLSLIEAGTLQPGAQLPSENDLAMQLGISRPTLREALLNLEQEGVIIRKHGIGTFVAAGYRLRLESGLECLESILELAARQGLQLGFEELRVDEEPADEEFSQKLQVPLGTPLTSVRRVIVSDRLPVAYMLDVIPAATLSPAEIDGTFNGSVLDLLRRKSDLKVAQAAADIVAMNADALLSEKLGVEPGQAVLLIEENLFDEEGMPLELSRNYFVPDFFRFHIVRR